MIIIILNILLLFLNYYLFLYLYYLFQGTLAEARKRREDDEKKLEADLKDKLLGLILSFIK